MYSIYNSEFSNGGHVYFKSLVESVYIDESESITLAKKIENIEKSIEASSTSISALKYFSNIKFENIEDDGLIEYISGAGAAAANSDITFVGGDNIKISNESIAGSSPIPTRPDVVKLKITADPISHAGRNGFIAYPKDGYMSYKGNVSGYLHITLPVSWTSTMISFTVSIYNFQEGESVQYRISGYLYSSGSWYNPSAVCNINPTKAHGKLPIRFGHDGSKCAVLIGNNNTSWHYPVVQIHDILVGNENATNNNFKSGWVISINSNMLSTIGYNNNDGAYLLNANPISQYAINKNGDVVDGHLYFNNDLSMRNNILFEKPKSAIWQLRNPTGMYSAGLQYNKYSEANNAYETWGGIGVYGNESGYDHIYISANTSAPWTASNGLCITKDSIKWKGSDVLTTASGKAVSAANSDKLNGKGANEFCTLSKSYLTDCNSFTNGMAAADSSTKNIPSSGSSWHSIIAVSSTLGSTSYIQQLAMTESDSPKIYFRSINRGTANQWKRLLTEDDKAISNPLEHSSDHFVFKALSRCSTGSDYGISIMGANSDSKTGLFTYTISNGAFGDGVRQFDQKGILRLETPISDAYRSTEAGSCTVDLTTTKPSYGIAGSKYTIQLPNSDGTLSVSSSDIRLKDNIKDTKVNALSVVNSIKFRQFDWNNKIANKHQEIGVVADELEKLDPHMVLEGTGGWINEEENKMNVKCVDTFYLMGYYGKAIQELSELVKQQQKEIETLKNELLSLKHN